MDQNDVETSKIERSDERDLKKVVDEMEALDAARTRMELVKMLLVVGVVAALFVLGTIVAYSFGVAVGKGAP